MSITSYATLQTAVASWLHRDDLTTQIPDFIALAEKRIYRDFRIRAMEASLSSAISSGVVAVPSGYVDMKYAYVNSSPVQHLQRKTAEWIYANYPLRSSEGKPLFFAREVDSFIFGPYPDSTYTIKGVYYKRLDALSDTNTSNWFITNAPDLLLYGALCEAAPFLADDPRIDVWEKKYAMVGERLQREDTMEDVSGGPLAVTGR